MICKRIHAAEGVFTMIDKVLWIDKLSNKPWKKIFNISNISPSLIEDPITRYSAFRPPSKLNQVRPEFKRLSYHSQLPVSLPLLYRGYYETFVQFDWLWDLFNILVCTNRYQGIRCTWYLSGSTWYRFCINELTAYSKYHNEWYYEGKVVITTFSAGINLKRIRRVQCKSDYWL